MLPTAEELQRMKEADIRLADKAQIKDIGEIQIDEKQPAESRMNSYLEQVQNPFLVKSGEYLLKFQYANTDKTFNDCMLEYVSKMGGDL